MEGINYRVEKLGKQVLGAFSSIIHFLSSFHIP